MRQQKVYRVQIGLTDSGGDHPNWIDTNVKAKDAISAAKRVKLGRNEYIEQIEVIARIDVE